MFGLLVYILLIPHTSEARAVLPDSVPNEYIIQLDPDIPEPDLLASIPGENIVRKYTIGSLEFALIKTDSSSSLTNFKDSKLKPIPNRIFSGFQNNDTCYRQDSGRTYYGLSRISSVDEPADYYDSYYFSDYTGQCVIIYVMDSGINVDHETFGERAHIGYTAQELDDKEGPDDLAGHGTHVAGLAGGSIHGTAKHANVVSVKVLDQNQRGQMDWILEGFEWISNHLGETGYLNLTSVISLSFGLWDKDRDMEFLDDVIRAIPAVSVAPAGNDEDDACDYVPARFDSVITVAATNIYDRFPYYTNVGQCVDILAPGHNIISASHRDNTAERTDSGTSMSAGFVSGVVARHLQNFTEQPTTSYMRTLLQETASANKTNADVFDTINLLLYAGCESEGPVVDAIPDWTTEQCFPYMTTSMTETTTSTLEPNKEG